MFAIKLNGSHVVVVTDGDEVVVVVVVETLVFVVVVSSFVHPKTEKDNAPAKKINNNRFI